jgi:hypothetical protein
MALGDRTPTELTAPGALTASAATYFTNTSSSFRTQMTGIWLCNTGSSTRNITLYKNGTATGNQISNSIQLAANSSVIIDLAGKALVFTGTQTFSAKQDTGTDCNIATYGVVEQIV